MENSLDKLLPESIRKDLLVEQACLAKVGAVPFIAKKDLDGKNTGIIIGEIFSLLHKSPYIMEIDPPSVPAPDECKMPYSGWLDDKALLLHDLKADLRVAVPRRRQLEILGSPFEPRCPEQFSICFKGFLFLAYMPIEKVTEMEVGQMAREILDEIFSQSKLLARLDRIHPNPLLPNIFFIQVKEKPETVKNEFPIVNEADGNLVILDSRPIRQTMDAFFDNVDSAIMLFYEARAIVANRDTEIINLSKLRRYLGELLVKHFQQNSINRVFSKASNEIRKTLGDIHLSTQYISLLELSLQRKAQITLRNMSENYFLNKLSNFLPPVHIADLKYDYNVDAKIIEFAAEETTNSTVAQITLVSAFLGALVGGLITVLIQFFSK